MFIIMDRLSSQNKIYKTKQKNFEGVLVSLPEDDMNLQALTSKPNFIYFKATQHFKIHWICL